MLEDAGFINVQVEIKPQSKEIIASWKIADAVNYAVTAYILARKPRCYTHRHKALRMWVT